MVMLTGHLGTAFSPNYVAFAVMRFIGGVGNLGYWNSAIILSIMSSYYNQLIYLYIYEIELLLLQYRSAHSIC